MGITKPPRKGPSLKYIQLMEKIFHKKETCSFRTNKYKEWEEKYEKNKRSLINFQNKIEVLLADLYYEEYLSLQESSLSQLEKIEILESILKDSLSKEYEEEKKILKSNKSNQKGLFNLLLEDDFNFNKFLYFRTFIDEVTDKKILKDYGKPDELHPRKIK
jgi:hypothetical protein